MKTPIILRSIAFILFGCLSASATVSIEWVTVGDINNPADSTGYGSVGYDYRIGKYEVTLGQYTEFLNAAAKTDPYGLYNANMATNPNIAGINRSGSDGSYSYTVIGSANRPVSYVSWFDAARMANWMHNGQDSGDTETGAYDLNGATTGIFIALPGAKVRIPNENEWYKAAYYSGTADIYWLYPTQSNSMPGNELDGTPNQANYRSDDFATTPGNSFYSSSQNYLTDVGAFTGSASYYGTFDQGGNLFEWHDAVVDGNTRGLRPGSWKNDSTSLRSYSRNNGPPNYDSDIIGFRFASVPEISTPIVSNIRAAQRAETGLVDIDYDLAGDVGAFTVTLEASADGGATYALPVLTVTGDVGSGVSAGNDLRITWDAGMDWDDRHSDQVRFRVTATNTEGFTGIPAGSFTMGSPTDEQGRGGDEIEHPVTVSAFSMKQTEVTWADWNAARDRAAVYGYTDIAVGQNGSMDDPSGTHPVTQVNWWDAIKWCNLKSEVEGRTPVYYSTADFGAANVVRTGEPAPYADWSAGGYRLPTEAEWEYACRAGTTGAFYTGPITHGGTTPLDPNLNLAGWYGGNSGSDTHSAGLKLANAFRLLDMHGNVWEWCWDWKGAYETDPQTDPRGPSEGEYRVRRGGGFTNFAYVCRSAERVVSSPGKRDGILGFRCVLGSVVSSSSESADVVVDTRSMYSLTTSGTNGTISGAGTYVSGSSATLAATPDPGYLFTGWTGDASGTDNPLSVLMDSDKTIGATFEPDLADDDGDGLTNYQELAIYGTRPDLPDTDGDDLTDAYEVGIGRYSLVTGGFTWGQAKTDAESRGGYLGTFTSQEEWDIALASLGPNALDGITGAWIGATDAAEEGVWTWITGEPFSFELWASGQPDDFNNSDVAEVSGGFGASLGEWFDTGAGVFREGYILETDYSTDPTIADGDGDGLNDGQERTAGSNPFLADTDGDGLTDGQEVNLTLTDPALGDTDANGTPDGEEDLDSDGLDNLAEVNDHGTDPRKADTDGDGVNDGDEVNYVGSTYTLVEGGFTWPQAVADAGAKGGRVAVFPEAGGYGRVAGRMRSQTAAYLWIGLNDEAEEGAWVWDDGTLLDYDRWLGGQPDGGAAENNVVIFENETTWADSRPEFAAGGYVFEYVGLNPNDTDSDDDGLTDGEEIDTVGSSPVDPDTDGDDLGDGDEVNIHGSSPTKTDTDGDGLGDYVEVTVHGSNPAKRDTDGDGFDDLFEVQTGFDPTSGTSTPEAYSVMMIAVEFRFNAAAGMNYKIESSTDMENWELVEAGIAGTGGTVTRFYTTEAIPKRYFRARRE